MNETPNPYESPRAECESVEAIVLSRESLAELMESYLVEEITAFQFDERLQPFHDADDPLLQHVAEALWFHYDDCVDHRVCLSKPEWDYFQRLLLALRSDCRVESRSERRWSCTQLAAAAALTVFFYLAVQWGGGGHLFALAVPFGMVSMAISVRRGREEPADDPYQAIIYPFATFSDLANAYRKSSFRKSRYPRVLAARTVRSPLMELLGRLYVYAMWILFSPLTLLFQTFPLWCERTRLVMDGARGD